MNLPKYKHFCEGITLIETMVVVAILGILAAVALPNYQSTIEANRRTTYANQLLEDLALARSEAIKRGVRVTVCPSSNGTGCTGANSWASGWITFVDKSTTGTVNTGETVLRVHEALALPSGWVAINNGDNHYVSYHPMGMAQNANGSPQMLSICMLPSGTNCVAEQPSSVAKYTDVIVSISGRVRIETKG